MGSSKGNGIRPPILEAMVPAASEPEPVTVVAAAVHEPPTVGVGSRWIAEKVPVEAHEAVLVLEREMHKAHAAFAAFEHVASSESEPEPAPIERDNEPWLATMAPPPIGTPVPVAEMPASVGEPSQEPPEKQSALAAAASAGFHHIERPAEVAKPPASPFAPPATASDESRHAVAAFGGPHPIGGAEPQTSPMPFSSRPDPIAPAPPTVSDHATR